MKKIELAASLKKEIESAIEVIKIECGLEVEHFQARIDINSQQTSGLIRGTKWMKNPNSQSKTRQLSMRVVWQDNTSSSLTSSFLDRNSLIEQLKACFKFRVKTKQNWFPPEKQQYKVISETVPCENDQNLEQSLELNCSQLSALAETFEDSLKMTWEVSSSYLNSFELYLDSNQNFGVADTSFFSTALEYSTKNSNYSEQYYSRFVPQIPELKTLWSKISQQILQIKSKIENFSTENTLIVLAPTALETLLQECVLENLDALKISQGESLLKLSQFEKKVFGTLSWKESPQLPSSCFQRVFDAEGIACNPFFAIENGILKNCYGTRLGFEELTKKYFTQASVENTAHKKNIFENFGTSYSQNSAGPTNCEISFEESMQSNVPKTWNINSFGKLADKVIVVFYLTGMTIDSHSTQYALDTSGALVFQNGSLLGTASYTVCGTFLDTLCDENLLVGQKETLGRMTIPWVASRTISCLSKNTEVQL